MESLYGLATPEKLYTALQRNAGDTISISTFMSTWTTQAGYPLVVVERNTDGKNLLISQRRFILRDRTHSDSTKWELHLNYALSTSRNFENTNPSFVMTRAQESIQLQLQEEVDWAIFNVQQTGKRKCANCDNLLRISLTRILSSQLRCSNVGEYCEYA